jgi:hypothetical protein
LGFFEMVAEGRQFTFIFTFTFMSSDSFARWGGG